jgi:hypothetical protein
MAVAGHYLHSNCSSSATGTAAKNSEHDCLSVKLYDPSVAAPIHASQAKGEGNVKLSSDPAPATTGRLAAPRLKGVAFSRVFRSSRLRS